MEPRSTEDPVLTSGRRLILLMALLTGVGQLGVGLYVPSMPAVADHFAVDDDHVKLTFSLYIAALALTQLVVGPLSDRFGRKVVIQAGNLLFLLASAACALAPSIGVLIVARALQGAGACVPVAVGRAVVRDVHRGDEAARALAAIGMVMALAPALGPSIGGLIQVTLGWRAIFVGLTIIGMVSFLLTQTMLDETLRPERRQPLRLGRIFGTYIGLLADSTYMAYGLAVAFAMAGLGAYLAGAPFVFIRLLGISEPVFGAFSIANVGSFAIGSAIASRITGRVFTMPGMIVFGGALCTLAGGALVAVMLAGYVSVPTILAPMVFYFVGMGMLVPNAMAAAINRYPDNAGLASALLGALQFGGWSAAGFAVGAFGTASAVPFGAVVAAVGASSLAAFLLLHGLPRRFRASG